jgi:hypothetical protein
MTSSPGIQSIGVVMRCLSPVCRLSRTRRTSALLRPVEAGYERIRRMVFLGSMMNTERMVNAMPFESTLVASWWSILVHVRPHMSTPQPLNNLHIVRKSNLTLLVSDYREGELAACDLVDIFDPSSMAVDCVGRKTNELCATLGKLRLQLGEGTKLSCADGSVVLGVREKNDPVVANELCSRRQYDRLWSRFESILPWKSILP